MLYVATSHRKCHDKKQPDDVGNDVIVPHGFTLRQPFPLFNHKVRSLWDLAA
jgi:hypothetical protein